jgi:hypothetical protein
VRHLCQGEPASELTDQTIWQVFEAERAKLVPISGRFDGFRATQASVSKTCLVRFDNNKYSVAARAVGRPVEIQGYGERIVIRQDGAIVGEHVRCFRRNQTIYDPWHYVPVLARKPGALRNGAPFKDWVLPASLEHVRRRLKGSDDGDRQILSAIGDGTTVWKNGRESVGEPKVRIHLPPAESHKRTPQLIPSIGRENGDCRAAGGAGSCRHEGQLRGVCHERTV